MRIGLVTCTSLPEPDPDQELTVGAMRSAGLAAETVAWDGPTSDLAAFDALVLRSCWNYYERPDDFFAWVERAAASTVLWVLVRRMCTKTSKEPERPGTRAGALG